MSERNRARLHPRKKETRVRNRHPHMAMIIPFAAGHCPLAWNRLHLRNSANIIYFPSNRTPQAVKHQMLRRKCLALWQGQKPGVQATLSASLRTKPPTTCKLVLGCCYLREENPSCFGSTPVALHSRYLREGRANRSRKKSESANVSSRRSAQVGKKARHNA